MKLNTPEEAITAIGEAVKATDHANNVFLALNFHDVEGGVANAAMVEVLLRDAQRGLRKALLAMERGT